MGEFTGNTYSLLHEFGEADFQEAVQTVLVRHWRRPEYRDAAERMLSDDDADVRRMAADALGVLSQNTRDARVFSLLLARIDDSAEEWHVRDTGKPMTWPDDALRM